MTVKELCAKHNITQTNLSRKFGVPLRTVQNWCADTRGAAPYIVNMMDWILTNEPLVDRIKELVTEESAK